MSAFQEIAALLSLSALLGMLAVKLRQPLIIAYILVGILAGPAVMNLSGDHSSISLLSEIGITVLLFVVGLKLDMHLVRTLGAVALATGLGQLAFTILAGLALCRLLGLDWTSAGYVAVALTFSSTIIIVKLLSKPRQGFGYVVFNRHPDAALGGNRTKYGAWPPVDA